MKPIKCRLLQIVAIEPELQTKTESNQLQFHGKNFHLPEIPERKETEDWQDHM